MIKSILLVEDDPAHTLIIKRALSRFATTVIACRTLEEGIAALRTELPEVIVTDLHLPDAAGSEITKALAHIAQDIPLLVLTSSNSLDHAVEAMRNGACDFIVKNFDASFVEVLGLSFQRVEAIRELEAKTREGQRRIRILQAAIDQGQHGFAVATANGSVIYSNPAFRWFVDRCEGDSTDLRKILGPAVSGKASLESTLNKNIEELQRGAVWQADIAFQKDQTAGFELILSVVGQDEVSEAREIVVAVRDSSSIKKREKLQRELLSTTTHDLKGPLGAVLLSSEMLLDDTTLPETARKFVTRIASSAHGAISLIDEFLSARRIQEGTFILKPNTTDVVAAAREVMDGFVPSSQSKDITLTFSSPSDAIHWKLDRLAFIRVISNLVSNALKFTKKGGNVTVTLMTVDYKLMVKVRDTGIGIEADTLHRIFERYGRAEGHSDYEGTGLGLFVVKAVVNAHGGSIGVQSSPNVGTEFELIFPSEPPVNERGEVYALDFA